ncbi:MAG: hemerythrin protein [Chitinophagaceae bacterium]|jgi:iron-sulfur cluster repair protein YtfE (RIC family)|nr:hemerythrin protein [Chitinophagaceae bacterium]
MPVTRTQELQPLSRQHHNGLLFCLLLKKGLKLGADSDVMREFIQWFWFKDLSHHFELEENYLIPLKRGYPDLAEDIDRMVDEHHELRNIINEISLNATSDAIDELQKSLEMHIRFEERILFPLIEKTISIEQRAGIGRLLADERDGNCMNYPVRFWE